MKLVQAGLFVRGLLRSHTKSCPLSPSPPSPPSPPTSLTSFSSGCFRDSHQVPIVALDRACSPGSSMIVRAPLLRYLRGNLSWICCGDIFWSLPALSGTVSPLSGAWAGYRRAGGDPAAGAPGLPAAASRRSRPHTQGSPASNLREIFHLESRITSI